MWLRLSMSFGLVLGSMALGWHLRRRRIMTEARAARMVRWIITVPAPLVLCFSFWRMDLRHLEPWLMPLVGLAVSASTLLPARLYAARAHLSDPQTGAMLACAFFSNLGYVGAFTAFALYGEAGYALCILYLVFFTPCFYSLGFAIGKRYGHQAAASEVREVYQERLRWYPFLGLGAGALLSLFGVPRPAAVEALNHVLIPLDTAGYLVAIGSQLHWASPRRWPGPCLAMSAIKFVYTPAVAWALVTALHIQGLPRIIVLLQASTPVAVSPLVLPLLFGLDRKLSNALWFATTALAIPWFVVLLPLLPHL